MPTKKVKLTPEVRDVLAELRRRGWRLEDLSFHTGLSHRTCESIARGYRSMTFTSAVKIARVFGWDESRLVKERPRV